MKKFNFASTLTNSTTYAGENLEAWILKAFTRSKFVESLPAQQIIDNIIYKTKVSKLSGSDLVQVGENCTFNDSGTIVASEIVLQPKPFFINIQLCYEDLEPIFNTLNSGSLTEQELKDSFADALAEVLTDKMNESTQDVFVNGVYDATGTTALTQFDGIDTQIGTGTTVTGATLTTANIIASLSSLVVAVPENVLESENLTIYMNRKTLQLYFNALAALAALTPQDTMNPTYMGIPIVTVPTIKANRMYCLETSNIFVGVGKSDEHTNLQIVDMRPLGQGNNVRLIMQGKVDCKLGWATEAAKYLGA